MARGESQTLLIWTIIFLILFLIMIVITFVMRSKLTEATTKLTDAESQIKQLNGEVSTLKSEGGKFREMIGYADPAMPMADIETKFAENLATFAATVPQQSTSYIGALQAFSDAYKNRVAENDRLVKDNTNQSILLAEQAKKEADLVANFTAKNVQLQEDLQTAQAHFTSEHEKMLADSKKLVEDNNKIVGDTQVALAEVKTRETAALDLQRKTTDINKTLAGVVADMESPIPTYTNAEILWVSRDSTTVRINIGSNHGLRSRMPFSVYGASENNISVDSSKGKIEVIRVIDGNTAEARVTEDILVNPIIPGDKIYTPVWKPGQKIRLALSSNLDLDGDGVSDPHKVITLIQMCGGEIDAYIDDLTGDMINENGKMVREAFLVGQIGDETRYLVTGNKPDPDASVTLFNTRGQLDKDAKMHGLTEITLKDLLNLMGQRPQAQKVGFGERNRATNNYEMEPEVVTQRMPGRVFNKYENPDAEPATTDKPPVSPLFNQRKITGSTGTASPLFQPRKAPVMDVEKN